MSRLPVEGNISTHTWLSGQQQKFMEGLVQQSRVAQEIFTKHGIWCPGFVGLKTMGKDMVVHHLQSCITDAFKNQSKITENIPSATNQIVELMVHPGYRTGISGGCGNGPDRFSQAADREHEMDILMSDDMLSFYKDNDISLASFQDCMSKVK